MPRLTDPEKLACYKNALSNWRYTGFIQIASVAADWLRREMPLMSERLLKQTLFEYVWGGGSIDEVVETRPEWVEHSFHYDMRLVVKERRLYVETLLFYDDAGDPDNPTIRVVNIHDA